MLVASTINSSARSSLHLIVIHHGEQRVLIPVDLFAKFSNLKEFAAEEWDLKPQEIVVETNELDICAGKHVRIHEASWSGVKDIIGNVYVRLRKPDQIPISSASVSTTKSRVTNSPSTCRGSESADEDEVEKQTRPASQKSDYIVVSSTNTQNEVVESKRNVVVPPYESRGDVLNLFKDNMADRNGEENTDASIERGASRKPTDRLGISQVASNLRVRKAANSTSNNDISSLKNTTFAKPKSVATNSSSEKSASSPVATSSLSDDKHAVSSGSGKTASSPEAREAGEATEPSDRVLIIIEAPGETNEARGFRIRREHTIQTVLKGATKALKLDYSRAKLLMIIDDDDEEDGMRTVKCNDADTIASLGIEDNQRFMIVLSSTSSGSEEDSD